MNRRDILRWTGGGAALASMGALRSPAADGADGGTAAAPAKTAFQQFIEYLAGADAIADRLGYTDPRLRPAYEQHVMMLLSLAYVEVFGTSVQAPDWVPHIPFYFPWGSPNQDDIYRFTPIDHDGSYVLGGVKGTAPVSAVTLRTGGAHLGQINGKTLAEIDLTTVEADASGRYRFLLSPERPAGYQGAWYALHPDTTSLLYRSRTTNGSQKDPTCWIERQDFAPGSAIATAEETSHRLAMQCAYAKNQNEFLLGYLNGIRARGGEAGFIFDDQSAHGGLLRQKYLMHLFTLADDEALLLESDVPKQVRYWSVEIFDAYFSAIENVYRQSAFNGEQVRVDPDGRVRFVISAQDPGIQNWLDTGGWPQGGAFWRWNEADSYPLPSVRKVKLRDLQRLLPAGTPRLDAGQRRTARSAHAEYARTRGR